MASSDPSNPADASNGQSLGPYQSECLPLSARGSLAALETRDGAFPPSPVGRASSLVAGPGMTSQGGGRENYTGGSGGIEGDDEVIADSARRGSPGTREGGDRRGFIYGTPSGEIRWVRRDDDGEEWQGNRRRGELARGRGGRLSENTRRTLLIEEEMNCLERRIEELKRGCRTVRERRDFDVEGDDSGDELPGAPVQGEAMASFAGAGDGRSAISEMKSRKIHGPRRI